MSGNCRSCSQHSHDSPSHSESTGEAGPATRGERPSVFYGLCGEGLGHFSRAAFLIPCLLKAGYSVDLFTSGRVAGLCAERFPTCRVHSVPGLRMKYRSNTLDVLGTTFAYLSVMARWPAAFARVGKLVRRCRPIAVISDYEPVVACMASRFRIPLISFDHQQIITTCETDFASANTIPGMLLRLSNRLTYLRPTSRIITSFYQTPLRRRLSRKGVSCTVIGPVLRPEVVRRNPIDGDHILVYQTSRTLGWLDQILSALPGEARVYGAGRKQSGQPERPFSEGAFLDDLASCRFAIVNGGHTTISEALYFGKPVLCFPVLGQAEQEVNAQYVTKLGLGMDYRPANGSIPDFSEFLCQENTIRQTIAARDSERCGNDDLLKLILGLLAQ